MPLGVINCNYYIEVLSMIKIKPNTMIKPGDGSMMTCSNKADVDKLILDGFGLDMYFGLMHYNNTKYKKKQRNITLSGSHYSDIAIVANSGLIGVEGDQIYKGLVSLGIAIKAWNIPDYHKAITGISKKGRTSKIEVNKKLLCAKVDMIDRSENAKSLIKDIVTRYGDNIYGIELWHKFFGWELPEHRGINPKPLVSKTVEDVCRKFSSYVINENSAKLNKEYKNELIRPYISEKLLIIEKSIEGRRSSQRSNIVSIREDLLIGFHFVSSCIDRKRLPEDDYCFYQIIKALNGYIGKMDD